MKTRMIVVICGLALAAAAPAAEIYVATNAVPASPYTNWAGAFTNLQNALDYAVTNPAITNIFLAGHAFQGTGVANSVFTWQNCTNMALRGGYRAAPADDASPPGLRDTGLYPTILRRSGGVARILNLAGLSNCVLDGLTIRDGYYYRISGNGAGLNIVNCHVAISNCAVINNLGEHNNIGSFYGSAVYVSGGCVTLAQSLIASNRCYNTYYSGWSYGGGIYVASNAGVVLLETVVASNQVASATSCSIGGGICNYGTLNLRNCLVVSNYSGNSEYGDAFYAGGGTAVLESVTLADNNKVGISYGGGAITISNSIVWGHTVSNLYNLPIGAGGVFSNVWYSNLGGGQNQGQQGCHSTDPLFVDRGFYHLQSTAGHYTNGYFSGGGWGSSTSNSPLIDRGDPAADYSHELEPNGTNVNMGAYGNTEVASKTPDPPANPPEVGNPGAQVWGHRTAVLRGEITEDYGETPETRFRYWMDGADTTNNVTAGLQSGAFQYAASGLTPATLYHYLAAASNRAGETLSTTQSFLTHPSSFSFFVSTNGNNTAGTNWASAYTNLPTAWGIAEPGDTLYLAGETFEDSPGWLSYSSFTWSGATNIALRGGYRAAAEDNPAAPGLRDSSQWPTVMRRVSGNARVLHLIGLSNCLLQEIEVRNGDLTLGAPSGGGIYLTNCQAMIFDACRVVSNNCKSTGGSQDSSGAGLYLAGSTVTLTNCLVATNYSTAPAKDSRGYGGAARVNGASRLTVRNSIVSRNIARGGTYTAYAGRASGWGGAFYVSAGGLLDVCDTLIVSNYVGSEVAEYTYGGALCNLGAAALRNCLLFGNWSERTPDLGDAIYAGGGTSVLENCTIANNNQVGIRYAGGTIGITNCIVWRHAYDLRELPADCLGRLTTVSHSLFGTAYGAAYLYAAMHGVNGCLTNDPAFTNAAAGDYRLLATSPAINAGINLPWMAGASDLDGLKPRIRGLVVDLGAYEVAPRPGAVWKMR